jgi:hypothetical protein
MGTSRDYQGSPNWSGTKGQVTGAGGDGAAGGDKAEKLVSSFVGQLATATRGGFGTGSAGGGGGGSGGGGKGSGGSSSGGGGGRRGGGGRISGGVRGVASGIGSFISDVVKIGLKDALKAIGLESCDGKSAEEVALALQEALGGPASTVDQEDLRAALGDLMEELMGKADTFAEIEKAFREAAGNLSHVIERLFGHYIYERFCTLHYANVMNTHGPANADSFFGSIKDYIHEKMNLAAVSKDLGKVDWKGIEGAQVVDSILNETIEIFSIKTQ